MVSHFQVYLHSTPFKFVGLAFSLILSGAILEKITGGSSLAALFLWSLSTFPLAAMFYGVRRSNRWFYGVLEAIFGFLACLTLLLFYRYGTLTDGLTAQTVGVRMLALMTGIFVLVRSYDNLGEGLTPETSARNVWDWMFPKG